MRVLIYPQPFGCNSGPGNVVQYLAAEIEKKLAVNYFPLMPSKLNSKGIEQYANGHIDLVSKSINGFEITHFLLSPSIKNGSFLFPYIRRKNNHVLYNIHGITQIEYQLYKKNLSLKDILSLKLFTSSMYKNASKIIVNSNYMRQRALEYYRLPAEKITVIPNGVNVKHFKTYLKHSELSGDPCILFVGHLNHLKGFDTLLDSISIVKRELPQLRLHIVGDKEIPQWVNARINREEISKQVVFHGWVPQTDLPGYYKAADFCIFPSVHDGFGIVLLEAMASGTPLIASDIDVFKERISNQENGLLFKNGNSQALAQAIEKLASDKKLRVNLSKKAFDTVQAYDWASIAHMYLELYESVIANSEC